MKIRFGTQLDGVQIRTDGVRMNELTCGVLGLVQQLELRLGIANPAVSQLKRIVCYERALIEAAKEPRFFSQSLGKDSFAVAATLLNWRDELKLAGWLGDAGVQDSPRVRDLAAVEKLAAPECASGLGDRLLTILDELDRRTVAIDSVEVIDKADVLPWTLRQVLQRLGAGFGAVPTVPVAEAGSDLRNIQEIIAGGRGGQVEWKGDGSVLALTAYSEVTLAHTAAQLFKDARAAGDDSVQIGSATSRPVETALTQLGEPITPLGGNSANRPILGVLALALRLRWKPLDPSHLLEFLTHPTGPLRRGLRHSLAAVVAEYPGMGSEAWKAKIEQWRGRIADEAEPGHTQRKALEKFEDEIRFWFDAPGFDPGGGAPSTALAETCARVQSWAAGSAATCGSTAEAGHFLLAASQARELGEVLREMEFVTRPSLQRLLGQTAAVGTTSGESVAEVGQVPSVRSPGAVVEPHDLIVWWGFHRESAADNSPWIQAERDALSERGVQLLPKSSALHQSNAAAARAVLSARKRLVLLIPKQRGHEPLGTHPLHDRLNACVIGGLPLTDLDSEVSQGGAWLTTAPIPLRRLPPLRRWWKLPDGSRLNVRAKESFTSAHQVIYNPLAWVFRYAAELRPGSIATINEYRQRGNLLHRVMERLFDVGSPVDWRTTTQEELNRWLDSWWQGLLETEGSNYLVWGRQTDGERLRVQAQKAVWSLVGHLRDAGVVRASVKVCPPDITFGGGTLGGEIDLLVETAGGSAAVVDLKYGTQQKPEELKQNTQLQLAIYGRLLSGNDESAWPEGAYYILRRARLLAQGRLFFPNARLVPTDASSPGLASCWRSFETVWNWRRGQLDAGWIGLYPDAAAIGQDGGTEPSLEPPILGWKNDPKARRYDDYTALNGWRYDQ
ncbi:MAG: PD-(D/E)XK nuclease family protein [Verrucomicrobiota bacterium]